MMDGDDDADFNSALIEPGQKVVVVHGEVSLIFGFLSPSWLVRLSKEKACA